MTTSLSYASSHPRRLVYLGTPELAVSPLRALVAAGFGVALVVTRVDKRRGRGGELLPSPVKVAAQLLGIPVSHAVDDVLEVAADLGVVVAFGQIIRPHILETLPMVNLHFSLLPRWRGPAPVERALLAGDRVTGVDLMRVDVGFDTGDIYARVPVTIADDDTLSSLRQRLVSVGSKLLLDTLLAGLGEPSPQSGEATYAAKMTPAELRIDWTRSADEIHRLVRLGGAWTTFRGQRLKVLASTIINGRLTPTRVQPEGKGAMDFEAWRNGARLEADERLGS